MHFILHIIHSDHQKGVKTEKQKPENVTLIVSLVYRWAISIFMLLKYISLNKTRHLIFSFCKSQCQKYKAISFDNPSPITIYWTYFNDFCFELKLLVCRWSSKTWFLLKLIILMTKKYKKKLQLREVKLFANNRVGSSVPYYNQQLTDINLTNNK